MFKLRKPKRTAVLYARIKPVNKEWLQRNASKDGEGEISIWLDTLLDSIRKRKRKIKPETEALITVWEPSLSCVIHGLVPDEPTGTVETPAAEPVVEEPKEVELPPAPAPIEEPAPMPEAPKVELDFSHLGY